MDMNRVKSGDLLQRIDAMIEELQQVRREIAHVLVQEAELAHCDVEEAPAIEEQPKCPPSGITCISSLEELYALDFEQSGEVRQQEESLGVEPESVPDLNMEIEEEAPSELLLDDFPAGGIDDLFVPCGSDEVLESAFEPKVSFHLSSNLSIADRYLFANELFFGNLGELTGVISEIERMSSWSQVESYLYDTLSLKKDSEEVERFASFIQSNMVK